MFSCEFCRTSLQSGIAVEITLLGRTGVYPFCDRACLIAWQSALPLKLQWEIA